MTTCYCELLLVAAHCNKLLILTYSFLFHLSLSLSLSSGCGGGLVWLSCGGWVFGFRFCCGLLQLWWVGLRWLSWWFTLWAMGWIWCGGLSHEWWVMLRFEVWWSWDAFGVLVGFECHVLRWVWVCRVLTFSLGLKIKRCMEIVFFWKFFWVFTVIFRFHGWDFTSIAVGFVSDFFGFLVWYHWRRMWRKNGKMWNMQRDLCQAVQKCGRIVEGVDVTDIVVVFFFFFFFEIILYYFNELKLK